MKKFPKIPQWGRGLVAHYNLQGGCRLHVPLGLCITQKATMESVDDIGDFVREQAIELQPELKPEYIKLDMHTLDKAYQILHAEMQMMKKEYAILAQKLEDEPK